MKKILVVEDDRVLSNLIRDELNTAGFETMAAVNGKEGLESALKNRPDLILVDIMMPVMDGMQMTTELRKDAWGKNVDVIVLTNLSDDKNIADFLEKGAYDYLVKSNWTIDDVVKRIKEKLGKGGK